MDSPTYVHILTYVHIPTYFDASTKCLGMSAIDSTTQSPVGDTLLTMKPIKKTA